MFKKILCPVDFSACSAHAMRVAAKLAADTRAPLTLEHAWHLPLVAMAAGELYPSAVVDALVTAEAQELAAAVAEAERLGAPQVDHVFANGVPWDCVCETLQSDAAFELVVMGTRGRTGFRRLLLGSVAEKVIRHAPCSVLAVRGRDAMSPFRHVLCAVDFTPSSRLGLELAAGLAARDGLGITLLHVIPIPSFHPDLSMPTYLEESERDARAMLADWSSAVRAREGAPITIRTEVGSPSAEILKLLDGDATFDLCVVGSHARTGLGRVLLGSIAEQIVRHAPCPVLVARPRQPRPA